MKFREKYPVLTDPVTFEPYYNILGQRISLISLMDGAILLGEEEFKKICIQEYGEEVTDIIEKIRKLDHLKSNMYRNGCSLTLPKLTEK